MKRRLGERGGLDMMTSLLGGPGKSSKQPVVKCVQAVLAILIAFVLVELFVAKLLAITTPATRLMASCATESDGSRPLIPGLPTDDEPAPLIPVLVRSPTLYDAISPENVVHWDNFTERARKNLRTTIDTSEPAEVRFLRYGMAPVNNVCLRPSGRILVVGVSQSDFNKTLEASGSAMVSVWKETYACEGPPGRCPGVEYLNETPADALWVSVPTTHIMPYVGNTIHHFGEKVWPLLTGYDLQEGATKPRYYYVHRMHTWLDQARHNSERNTFVFQTALLARMAPAKFLQHGDGEARPLCFHTLMLSHDRSTGRISPALGVERFAPGLARYRAAAFDFFRVPLPRVTLPPRPLRVTLYGRRDASRRRITNIDAVAHHLRTSMRPGPVVVTSVDDLMARGLYGQSLPEVVSLMSQTDVLITAHGASTWETVFMPEGAAVLEIHGPCGPGTWIGKAIVPGLRLKFRNPRLWGERVPEPRAGNTTECIGHSETPNYTIDLDLLRTELESLRAVDGPGDRLPLHWLFDWARNSY